MSSNLTEANLERKFSLVTNTQDSIQTLSLWLLHHRAHHQKIVGAWMKVLKKAKVSHRLTLFYLANDVIQNSKRKGVSVLKDSFAEILREATALVRDEQIRASVNRVFSIWEQRSIFDSDFIADLQGILTHSKVPTTASSKLVAEFKYEKVIEKLKAVAKMEVESTTKIASINLSKLNSTNAEIVQKLKDRQHGQQFSSEFDENARCLDELVKTLTKEIKERNELIQLLEQSEIYYDTQRGEAKIVANAYRNFGTRVKTLQKKLEDLTETFPPPSPTLSPCTDVPSPSNSDLETELSLPGDRGFSDTSESEEEDENVHPITTISKPMMYSPIRELRPPIPSFLTPQVSSKSRNFDTITTPNVAIATTASTYSPVPSTIGEPIPIISNFFLQGSSGMSSWLDAFTKRKDPSTVPTGVPPPLTTIAPISPVKSNVSNSLDSRLSNLLQNIPNLPSGLQETLFGPSASDNATTENASNSPVLTTNIASACTFSTSSVHHYPSPVKDSYVRSVKVDFLSPNKGGNYTPSSRSDYNSPSKDDYSSPMRNDSSPSEGFSPASDSPPSTIKEDYSGQNTPLQDEDTPTSSASFFSRLASSKTSQNPKDILKGLTELIHNATTSKKDSILSTRTKTQPWSSGFKPHETASSVSSYIKPIPSISDLPLSSSSPYNTPHYPISSLQSENMSQNPIFSSAQNITSSSYEYQVPALTDSLTYSQTYAPPTLSTPNLQENLSFIPTLVPSTPLITNFNFPPPDSNFDAYDPESEQFEMDVEMGNTDSDYRLPTGLELDGNSPIKDDSDDESRSDSNRSNDEEEELEDEDDGQSTPRQSTLITVVTNNTEIMEEEEEKEGEDEKEEMSSPNIEEEEEEVVEEEEEEQYTVPESNENIEERDMWPVVPPDTDADFATEVGIVFDDEGIPFETVTNVTEAVTSSPSENIPNESSEGEESAPSTAGEDIPNVTNTDAVTVTLTSSPSQNNIVPIFVTSATTATIETNCPNGHETMEMAAENMQTVPDNLQMDPDNLQIDSDNLQIDSDNLQVDPDNLEIDPDNLQMESENMHMAPENMQMGRENIHMAPENMHMTPENMHMMPENMHMPPQNMHMPPQNMHMAPQNIHMAPQNMHMAPENMHMAPQNMHMAPENMHNAPENIQMIPETYVEMKPVSYPLSKIETVQSFRTEPEEQWYQDTWVDFDDKQPIQQHHHRGHRRPYGPRFPPPPRPHFTDFHQKRGFRQPHFLPRNNWQPRERPFRDFNRGPPPKRFAHFNSRGRGWMRHPPPPPPRPYY